MNSPRPRALTRYVRSIRRRKLTILFSVLVFAAASGIAVRRLPSVYESSAVIATESSIDSTGRLAAIKKQLMGRQRLEAIIAKHSLYDGAAEKPAQAEAVVSQMRSDIRVSAASDGEDVMNAFVISYRATDPRLAQQVTADLAEQLIAESAAQSPQATGEMEVLKQRAAELTNQMRELEAKAPWLATAGDHAPATVPAPASRGPQYSAEIVRAQQMTIEGLRDQQYKIQQQLADLERRLTTQRQIVEQQKKGTGIQNNPTYAALVAKRAELQGQRDTLINRQELTDKHPRVVAIGDQINAINRQIEELRQQDATAVGQSAEARELAALESDRTRLQLEFEITGREIARRTASATTQTPPTPAVQPNPARRDPASARLIQEYIDLKRSYEEVTAKLDTAQSKQATGGPERLRLVKEASLPDRPASPDRLLLAAIAAAAGLALGAVFALIIDSRRSLSLQDAKDVEYYARIPLLAAIPRTMTADERRSFRVRAGLRLALGAVIAAAAAFALAQAFTAVEVFKLIARL